MNKRNLLQFVFMALLCFSPVYLFSQQNPLAPVQSKWELVGVNLELNYYNSDYCDYYMVSSRAKELWLGLGKTNLVSVPRENAAKYQNNPEFMPSSFVSYKGYFPEQLNPDFLYSLPVRSGKNTISKVDITKRAFTYLFVVGAFDTVYAVRAGSVCKNQNQGLRNPDELLEENNAILMYHADRTFARYGKLTKLFVREGEQVSVGQALGLVANKGLASISFFYLDKNKFADGNKAGLPHTYFHPLFHTSEGNVKLEENKSYLSDLSEELITQEMSKREKKRYEKKKLKLAQK